MGGNPALKYQGSQCEGQKNSRILAFLIAGSINDETKRYPRWLLGMKRTGLVELVQKPCDVRVVL